MMLAKVEKQDGMTIAKVKTYLYQSASIPTTAACWGRSEPQVYHIAIESYMTFLGLSP